MTDSEDRLYRTIFRKAVMLSWHHRELWPLAAMAGMLTSGTIMHDLWRTGRLSQVLFDGAWPLVWPPADFALRYLRQAALMTDWNVILSASLIFLAVLLGVVVFFIASQHAVFRALHRRITHDHAASFEELWLDVLHPRTGSLLLANLFGKILLLNFLLVSGVLIARLNPLNIIDSLAGIIFSLVIVTIAFVISGLTILTITRISADGESLRSAFGRALQLMRNHAVVIIEWNSVIFALQVASLGVYAVAVTLGARLLAIPLLSVTDKNLTAYLGAHVFIFLLFALFTIGFSGFVVTATYASWTLLDAELSKTPHTSRFARHFTKLRRK